MLPTIATSEGGHIGFCKKGRKTLSINEVWVQRSCDATNMAPNQSTRTKDHVPSYTVSAEVIWDSNLPPSQALCRSDGHRQQIETTLNTIEIGLFIQYPAPAPKQYISTIAHKVYLHTHPRLERLTTSE
jgi:hypothetical protein